MFDDHLSITTPSGLLFQIHLRKTTSDQNHCVSVCSLSQRTFFFNFYCLFCERFSAAYLLKLFLLPQRVHTTLFIRCDNPKLTRWCLCSLHAGIQKSPNEVVGSRDGCRHSIADGTIDVHICLFRQIFSAHTTVVLVPVCIICSLHLVATQR